MTPAIVSPEAIIERLDALRDGPRTAIVWDGDGTLWTGDVGEDTFSYAIAAGALRTESAEALAAFARAHGVSPKSSAVDTARAILRAYEDGQIPDLPVCEAMTWCYAGHSESELRALARSALEASGLANRRQRLLEPIVQWARREVSVLVVVSASPKIIVEEAAHWLWGFDRAEIIGARARLTGDLFAAELLDPVPFGPQKTDRALSHLKGAAWLASFGDNFFDLEMLRAARLGVAVRPKPALRERLRPDDTILVLE